MLTISRNLLWKDQLFNHCFNKICTAEVYFISCFSCNVFFFRTEADEYIHMGALNGLFVLGRSVGFIGKSSMYFVAEELIFLSILTRLKAS